MNTTSQEKAVYFAFAQIATKYESAYRNHRTGSMLRSNAQRSVKRALQRDIACSHETAVAIVEHAIRAFDNPADVEQRERDANVYLSAVFVAPAKASMTLDQIKAAVDAGKKVFHQSEAYEVRKWKGGEYVIVCTFNDYAIGLTWQDGVTMNGKPEQFYMAAEPVLRKYRATFHGRTAGALGVTHACTVTVEAVDEKAALLALYKTHEHIMGAKFTEQGV